MGRAACRERVEGRGGVVGRHRRNCTGSPQAAAAIFELSPVRGRHVVSTGLSAWHRTEWRCSAISWRRHDAGTTRRSRSSPPPRPNGCSASRGLVLGDTHQAEDAVQDALVRAWRGLPSLRDPDRWDAWLHRLHRERVCRSRAAPDAAVGGGPVRADRAGVGDDAGTIDDHDQLDRGFQRLKPHHRAAIVLHFYLDLSVPRSPTRSASRWERRSRGSTTQWRRCGPPSRRTSDHPSPRQGGSHDDHRPIRRGAHPQLADRDRPSPLPDRVLTDTYERTRQMAQASSVRTWRSRVTRPLPIVFAAGAIAVVLVAVSVGLGRPGRARSPLGSRRA